MRMRSVAPWLPSPRASPVCCSAPVKSFWCWYQTIASFFAGRVERDDRRVEVDAEPAGRRLPRQVEHDPAQRAGRAVQRESLVALQEDRAGQDSAPVVPWRAWAAPPWRPAAWRRRRRARRRRPLRRRRDRGCGRRRRGLDSRSAAVRSTARRWRRRPRVRRPLVRRWAVRAWAVRRCGGSASRLPRRRAVRSRAEVERRVRPGATGAGAGAGGCRGGPGGRGGAERGRRQHGRRGRRLGLRLSFRLGVEIGTAVPDVDAEVGGQPGQPRCVALADGAELPAAVAAVQLAGDERGLVRGASSRTARCRVPVARSRDDQPQPGHLPERAAVGRRRERDPLDVGGQARRGRCR